jgi:hypothetical protein
MKLNEVLPLELETHLEESIPYHYNNWDLVYLRNTRNSLLQLTDKYLIPDYPITPENLEIIKAYRQELRDFINIYSNDIINGKIIELPKIPLV